MGTFLQFSDLSPLAPSLTEAEAAIIIEDVEAQAVEAAPCILEDGFPYAPSIKSILRQAALRWHRTGGSGVTTVQASRGPYSQSTTIDTRSSGEGRLWPSEAKRLQALCRRWKQGETGRRKAFTILPGPRR